MCRGRVRGHGQEARQLRAEPCDLALGIGARVGLAAGDRGVHPHFAAQRGDQTGDAVGAHHRQCGIKRAFGEAGHFPVRATGHHRIEPRVDAGAQGRAVHVEEHRMRAPPGKPRRVAALVVEIGEGATGCGEDLEGALQALGIGRAKARGCPGVEAGEAGVKVRGGQAVGLAPDGLAHLGRDGGQGGEAVRQRLEIEPGAADDDRQRPRVRQHMRDGVDPAAHREVLRPVHRAKQAVGGDVLLVRRRARRDDPQVGIDLHGIGIDDDAAGVPRQRQGEGRLAARGRTCDEDRRSPA